MSIPYRNHPARTGTKIPDFFHFDASFVDAVHHGLGELELDPRWIDTAFRPASHALMCLQASLGNQRPLGKIRPDYPARLIKSLGPMSPRAACRHSRTPSPVKHAVCRNHPARCTLSQADHPYALLVILTKMLHSLQHPPSRRGMRN